jgi:hypothetical protein
MIPHISDIGVVYEFRVLARCCYFSIFAWSLKMKRDDLHMQDGDIKETSSVFWSGEITRTQEIYKRIWLASSVFSMKYYHKISTSKHRNQKSNLPVNSPVKCVNNLPDELV